MALDGPVQILAAQRSSSSVRWLVISVVDVVPRLIVLHRHAPNAAETTSIRVYIIYTIPISDVEAPANFSPRIHQSHSKARRDDAQLVLRPGP